jgi:hypothetical protein
MRELPALVLLAPAFGGGFATVWTLTAPPAQCAALLENYFDHITVLR